MEKKLTLKRLIIPATGLLFAAYSAYNVFIVIRDGGALSSEGILISIIVALLFAVLAAYVWTAKVKRKKGFFRMVRRTALIIALIAIFALKLRMVVRVVEYVDFSELQTVFVYGEPFTFSMLQTLLYGAAYFMTLAAMLILIIYFIVIRKRPLMFPKASVALPVTAMVLFLVSLIMDMVLFLAYGVNLEASPLRTAVMRPVFYLGFIGLCAYCL